MLTSCFDVAQDFALSMMERHFFPAFKQSEFYSKFLISVITSGNISINDVLHNESTLMVLMEHMEREGNALLLHFYLSASNFRQQIDTHTAGDEIRDDAQALYRKFFASESSTRIEVDQFTRAEIDASISSISTMSDRRCFARAEHLVFTALQKYYFPNFLHSDLMYKYLNGNSLEYIRRLA